MTRLTRKEKSLALAMILLIVVLIVISLSSCGSAYHLQRADHHIDKAIKKGADRKRDTIRFHFRSPAIKFETTLKPEWIDGAPVPIWKGTDEKTGVEVKAKISLKDDCPPDCIETVTLQGDCPPQEQVVEVPCETVQAGYTKWEVIILALAMIPGGWLIMTFIVVPLVKKWI